MKKEIQKEKQKHSEKFIETSEALQKEDTDCGLFVLGLISQNLESIGIETAIEKDGNQKTEKMMLVLFACNLSQMEYAIKKI